MLKELLYVFSFSVIIILISACEPEIAKPPKKTTSVNVISVNDRYKRNIYSAVNIGNKYWFQGNLNKLVYTAMKNVNGRNYDDTINCYKTYSTSIVNLTNSTINTQAAQWPNNGENHNSKKIWENVYLVRSC